MNEQKTAAGQDKLIEAHPPCTGANKSASAAATYCKHNRITSMCAECASDSAPTQSDTQRTEEELIGWGHSEPPFLSTGKRQVYVRVEFARQLERELAALKVKYGVLRYVVKRVLSYHDDGKCTCTRCRELCAALEGEGHG